MREIKFRGKTVKGDWVFGDLIHTYDYGAETHTCYEIKPIGSFQHRVISETVGQYTCNFDSFDGDIVIVSGEEPYSNEQFITDYDWTFEGTVKQVDGSWCVINADNESILFHEIINNDMELEIIGTIHDKDLP